MTPTILVNGQPRELPGGHTIADLLRALALEGKRVAIERNGDIVSRSRYAQTVLQAGDKLEIVVAVGGG